MTTMNETPKQDAPDFLLNAAGFILSDFPQDWNGEQIVSYLEENSNDYEEEITPWIPFENYNGELLAEYIENLAGEYERFFNMNK